MRTLMIAGAAGVLILLSSCEQSEAPEAAPAPAEQPAPPAGEATVLDMARSNPEFTTLARLLNETGLGETLDGPEPYTLFAPTNTAFDKLSDAERGALSRPESRAALRTRLALHIVPGRLTLADIAGRAETEGGPITLTTLEGGPLSLREEDGQWRVTDARGGVSTIAMPDVTAANGVIHAVDTVMWPN